MSASTLAALPLEALPEEYVIYRLPPATSLPALASLLGEATGVLATLHSDAELSVVCPSTVALPAAQVLGRNGPWRALRVKGELDFALTGILAALTQPLADAGISIFAISSYNTDYLLVPADRFTAACQVLADAGCSSAAALGATVDG